MGNCAMERKSQYQTNADIQCSEIKSLYQEAKQLFQQDDKIIVTPIMKISHNVYLKLENMQISGSFKYRGAYLYFNQIYSDKVIIASSGNFAKACDLAHQKIMKEREFIQSRHKLSNFIMANSRHKDQELDNYKNIQKLQKQQTQSISENDQQETLVNEQNKTQGQNVQDSYEKNSQNQEVVNKNKKIYQGQLSSDGQEFDQSYENNFRERFSPNQSVDFKIERDLSVASLISQENYFETPTDNPDLVDIQSQPHQKFQKFSYGNSIQFHSKNEDIKNENNKQSNNPIYFDQKSPINQEYETPTPLPDDQQQQDDFDRDQNNKVNGKNIINEKFQDFEKNIANKLEPKNIDEYAIENNNLNESISNKLNGSKSNNLANGGGNGHHVLDDAIQQHNNQQKQLESEAVKESAKEFVKLKGSTYTFSQSNHIKDSKQLGLQIDKTGSQLIIVVPETVKQEKIKDIKSQIVKYSTDCVECEVQARQYANQNHGFRYFSPYNDIYMIAGNATIGYEMAEQLAEVSRQADYLFVAVGGGGLISGIAFYFKVIREQKIKIIGVQPQKNCAMYNIVYGKNNILEDTVCDATAGGVEFNAMTIQICKHMVDEWVLIKEQDILKGQKKLWNDHKIVVETSAAMAFVACENYQKISQKTYVALLCGGNVDIQF